MKQVSDHKTASALQSYILVTEDEMSRMQWLEQKEEKTGTMDICEQSKNKNTRNLLKSFWDRQDLNLRPDDYESKRESKETQVCSMPTVKFQSQCETKSSDCE